MHAIDWQTLLGNLIHFGAPDTVHHPVTWAEKIIRPVAVYLVLVFGLRTFGRRVLAQLNPFDLVVLLTLSNTVQNAIIGNDTSLSGGVIGAAALFSINTLLVRLFYRGPSKSLLFRGDKDVSLIKGGELCEEEMRGLHITAGELLAKAHERGFDSLDEVESAMLYANGIIYFRGKPMTSEGDRFVEIIRRLETLGAQVSALRPNH
ncbi:MAG TPA: YetF domain-containing protein [Gemmatimonadales bacterium]|jgi:uncharacterized membrane protein YcaP (DUF421 family)